MRARLRRALADDRGMTLTELLVVMIIVGIIVAVAATLTIGMSRTNGQNIARQDLVDGARTAVERISKTARTSVKPSQLVASCSVACADIDAFLAGTSYSMKFYANLDNPRNTIGPSQITYTIATSGTDAGVLVEKVQRPDSNVPGTNGYTYCDASAAGATTACKNRVTTRRLVTGVVTTTPVFTYFSADGSALSAGGSGLSSSDLEKVQAVEVTLTVRSSRTTAPRPVTYIQRITMPNAQAVMQQGENTP